MSYLMLALGIGMLILVGVVKRYVNSAKGKGKIGEMIVSKRLREGLGDEYVILDDLYFPTEDGTTTQVDHVAVSRYGIFVVETKNYSGWIFGDAKDAMWTKSDYGKKSRFQNPMRQNYRHLCTLSENLGIPMEYFIGVVAFCGMGEFKTEMPEGVVYSKEAAKYIKSFTNAIIKDEQIGEVVSAIRAWADSVGKDARASHVENLRARHAV